MAAVLVVGAYGGIGSALVHLLSQEERPIIIAGRNFDKAQAMAERYGQRALSWDARDDQGWQTALAQLQAWDIELDAIVQLSGSILIKPLSSLQWSEVQETIDRNVLPAFLTLKYGAPLLAQNGGGSIVLMSSVAAQVGLMHHEAIAAAKAAVEGLALSAAASYAAKNVRINVLAPALVETPLSARFVASEEARKASAQMHPMGRIGQADDVARILATLVHPLCSWVTGQVFGVDGGMSRIKGRR